MLSVSACCRLAALPRESGYGALARCRSALVCSPDVQVFLIRYRFFFFFFLPIIYRRFNWAFAQPGEIRCDNASLLPIWTGAHSLLSPQKQMRFALTPSTLLAGIGRGGVGLMLWQMKGMIDKRLDGNQTQAA